MLKVLFLSGLYSTPRAPWLGPGNARILHEMRPHAAIQVVAPVPYYPPGLRRGERIRELSSLPRSDKDDDGATLYHPRRAHIPGLFSLQAALYVGSLALPLHRIVRDFQPDAVLSAWAYPDGCAAVALSRWLDLPCVVRVMGSDINDFAQQPRRRSQIRWAMRNASRVIAVSSALGDEVEKLGVPRAKIAVIPTGVDLSKFHPLDRVDARRELALPKGPLVLVVSRLSREKGVHFLLDALARMDPGVHAVLVGDGPEEPALRAQAEQLGLTHRVHFAGFQKEPRMKLYYSAADVTCLSSTEEGWPDVLMEAFACGCPVVASRVGGVPEIIALTGDGIAVPPTDVAALSAALTASLARTPNREVTAARMREHTLQLTAQRYCETCAAVVAEKGPRRT